ncbi:MAG: hypothetical protein WD598_01360 [Acidimicrobiia bacterium]
MDSRLRRIARRQLALITYEQALRVLTESQIKHRVRRGELDRVREGVLRVAGAPETWDQLLLAACLAGGRGAVASFRSAAWLWRLMGFEAPDAFEITVRRARRARLPGVVVHDTVVRGRLHTMRSGCIPVTTPARTLCDLTACCPPWVVERALDDALRRRLTTLQQLHRVFLDLKTKGRRRSTVMRAILEARTPGFDAGGSDQELKIVQWIVEAGLPPPRQQHRVRVGNRTYKPDLAYPELKIAIEYDGWDAHRMRTSFDADRDRDMDLEDEDWRVLHFTAKSSRRAVVERVRNALAQRSK